MELLIGIPILVILYAFLILWTLAMLNSTIFVKSRKKLSTYITIVIKNLMKIILVIYLIAGFIMLTLVVVNVFHKLNKFNLTEVEALVLGGDWQHTRSHRGGGYTNYELFLIYLDDEEEMHITEKSVTGPTYRKSEQGDKITLFYRKNNVYDTFVQTESMREVWPAYLNFFTLIIGLYVVSLFYLIRKWHRKRQAKRDEQDTEDIPS